MVNLYPQFAGPGPTLSMRNGPTVNTFPGFTSPNYYGGVPARPVTTSKVPPLNAATAANNQFGQAMTVYPGYGNETGPGFETGGGSYPVDVPGSANGSVIEGKDQSRLVTSPIPTPDFAGSSTGNAYNVGKTYTTGGGMSYGANADGTFSKLKFPQRQPLMPGMVPGAVGIPRAGSSAGANPLFGGGGLGALLGSLFGGGQQQRQPLMPGMVPGAVGIPRAGTRPPLFGGGGGLGALLGSLFGGQAGGMFGGSPQQQQPLPGMVPGAVGIPRAGANPLVAQGMAIGEANRRNPNPTYNRAGANNAFQPRSVQNSVRWQTGY